MQRARNHDFISGKQDVSDSTWRQQRSALTQHSGVHRFVNFVVYYFESGRSNTRPSHNILLNRSIAFLLRNVHTIRLHVSEVPCSGAVCAHSTCVPRPCPTEPCSGPPLPTKPGPAKRTRAWARYGAITLVKRTGLWGSDALGHGSKRLVWVQPLENNRTT